MERKTEYLTKEQQRECKKILDEHPLFGCFSEDLKNQIVSKLTLQRYKKGERVVLEGDAVDSIYFIEQGSAEVIKEVELEGQKKQKVPVSTLHRHESIGLNEKDLYSETGKHSATVVALSNLTLFRLELEFLITFIKEHPAFLEILEKNALLSKADFIKQAAPFASLSAEDLYAFAKEVKDIYLDKGGLLFEQGDEAENCYLLVSGKIEIFLKEADNTARIPIAELEPPAIMGEAALLMNATRNASAVALEDSKLFVISRELLFEVMGKQDETAEALMNMVALRSRPVKCQNIEEYHIENSEGEDEITLKDSENWKYFRLTERGWFIWQQINGKNSLRDITMAYFLEFHVFNPGLVADLIMDLDHAGFLVTHAGEAPKKTVELHWFWKALIQLRRFMEMRVAFKGVDEWVTKTYQNGIRFLFTPFAWMIFILLSVVGFWMFGANFDHAASLISQSGMAKWWLLLLSIPAAMMVTVLHELSHAYTTKFFGRKVRAFGVGWFWVGPIAFCDTSDMWLNKPYQRVMVDLAGIFLHFVVAGTFSIVFISTQNDHFSLFCWYVAFFNYLMIFENLKPIIELDGYYALMDGLNHPNLKLDAVQWASDWPGSFSQLKQYKAEAIYWLSCVIYLILEFIFPLLVLRHLLKGFFGITNPLWSLLLSFLVLVFSVLSIWAEIKQRHLERKR